MARAYEAYSFPPGAAVAHPAAVTSTGTANVQSIPVPKGANAMFICAETTGARVTFDGTTPDATHGIVIIAGAQPLFVPIGAAQSIQFVSAAAGNSIVSVLFLA